MGSLLILRALQLAVLCVCAHALTTLSAVGAGDDGDCALYLNGPGRTSAYDYSLNLLKGNFNYEGQHTCITYDAINQAYLEARNRIVVSQPKGDWKAEDFASVGELILDISINLARRYGLTYEEIEKGLPLIDTSRTLIRDVCPPVFSHVECRAGKYRRLDGLCNNLQNPTWGSTMSPFQRLIGPLFSDGINAPRISHTGRDLPLSRVVSRTMHPDHGYHDHAGTVMVIAWGQFMDHDYTLTGTPLDPLNRNDPEECCKRPPHLKHPYCNEIRIPDDDYFYRLWGVKCIDFVRAFPSPRPGCRLGSRVPFNTLTGVIDGNTIYGVTDKFSRKLRTGFGGLLRMNPVFKEYGLKDLLPLKLDIPDEGCTRPNKNMYCFEAGEIRVNEQLVLTVMHTLMAREHNRIARSLAEVNPHWDDETLFQESRRINVAEIQHITYNEFLPILLGKDVMEKFGLVLEKEGYWDGYDQQVNPDVIDAFASAAFRFGHSLLPTAVERWSKAHKFIASKRLSDLIRRPYDLYRAGVLDEYVMGLMNQVAQAMDDSITQEVTNHLFKKVGARFGMDLVSFNMQRGREFGIPGYMEFRKFCGLAGADSFQDLFGSMPNETVVKYQTIFEHPIDVDLWSGGVSERPLPGSMLGPTFACVIATQFSYSRRGDRFWFELPNQPSSFTPEQLAEVRKARLARVICDNTDIIDTVQLYPMVLPDHELNPRVPCRSGIIPGIDFSKWAEPAPFHASKPFITEAYVKVNETNDEQNITAIDNIKLNSSLVNNTEIINNDKKFSSTEAIHKGDKNEQHETDTVMKYVYKEVGKINVLQKPKSHPLNSLRRKKRSSNSPSAPLIVNYETNHDGPQSYSNPSSERLTGKVVKTADKADFNIETLHDHQQHQGQPENTIHRKPHEDKSDENGSEGRIIVEDDDNLQVNNESTNKGARPDQDSNEDRKESQENKIDRKINSGEQNQERDNDDSRENSESKESYRADGESSRRREDYKSNESLHIDSREKPYIEGDSSEKSEYQDGSSTEREPEKFPTSHETILFNVDARYHNRGNQDSDADNADSNDSREQSGESANSNSAENRSNENSKFTDTKLRPDSSESDSKEKEHLKENVLNKIVHQLPEAESSEEEAIIAIMKKKKKKKQHDKPADTYTATDEIYNKKSSPIKIKDVDLSDFTYERIHLNEKGVVAPVKDIHYKDKNAPLIQPVTTVQPNTEHRNEKYNANFVSSTGIPYASESSEENKEAVKIDDPEVKPVVEINSENKESIENNSKEALKAAPNDDDLSLETLLGVKLSDSEEKGDKIIEQDSGGNGDVKQQFERIPLNYNHAQTEQQNNEKSDEHKDTLQNDHNEYNPEPVNILTPKMPVKYDEHLNFKFDDVTIKLPEIHLPDDIISFPSEDEKVDEGKDESSNAKTDKKSKKDPKKTNFFHYDEHEYNADEPHSHRLENLEDHEPSYYNYNYGKEHKKEKYKKKDKQEEDSNETDDKDDYRSFYDHSNDDDEDLYEKFVRERFGKKDTFEQRSAKLSAPTRPAEDNAKLFQALQNVLVRTQNIEKEAIKSGDPNAGYMWTVEYGRDL